MGTIIQNTEGIMSQTKNIITDILKCPVCSEGMYVSETGKSLYCNGKKRHCFDFSSDGYVNLAMRPSGDSKEAVNARKSFLSKDYYLPLAEKICEIVREYAPKGILIDAGCGEGYYTNKLAKDASAVLGFDLSKFGVASASKSARREGLDNTFYATASVFELPVVSESCDCVVNIFAPCAPEEYTRVLKDGGVLVVVGAGKSHLMGLKEVIYEHTYENGDRADLPKATPVEQINLGYEIEVEGKENIQNLFSMTPYYWRTSESDREKLTLTDTLKTYVEFELYIYKKESKGLI